MRILFLHGWTSVTGGLKPTFLKERGHVVLNPALPDEDFEESVWIAEAECTEHVPDVIVARSRFHEGTKGWDKILLSIYFPAMLAVMLVAALDDGRFHWFPVPWWVCGIGYALLLAGIGIVTWKSIAAQEIQMQRRHS